MRSACARAPLGYGSWSYGQGIEKYDDHVDGNDGVPTYVKKPKEGRESPNLHAQALISVEATLKNPIPPPHEPHPCTSQNR